MPQVNTQVHTLINRLDKVQQGKALGVDEQGQLIGEALLGSWKGKLVHTLVDRGLAHQGKLGGWIAVALIGSKNFELLSNPPKDYKKSSITNVLNLIKTLETKELDSDLQDTVSKRIKKIITEGASLKTVAQFRTLHEFVQQKIIPQRIRFREDCYSAIQSDGLPPTAQKAHWRTLAVVQEALQKGVSLVDEFGTTHPDVEKLYNEHWKTRVDSQMAKQDIKMVAHIAKEINAGIAYIRLNVDNQINEAQGAVDALTKKISDEGAAQKDPTTVAGWELQLKGLQRELQTLKDNKAQIINERAKSQQETILAKLPEAIKEKQTINIDDEDLGSKTPQSILKSSPKKKRVRFEVDTSGDQPKIKEDIQQVDEKISFNWSDTSTVPVSQRGRQAWAEQITKVLNDALQTTQKEGESEARFQARLSAQNGEVVSVMKTLLHTIKHDTSKKTTRAIAGFLKHPALVNNYEATSTFFSNFSRFKTANLVKLPKEIRDSLHANAATYRASALAKRAEMVEVQNNPTQYIGEYQHYVPYSQDPQRIRDTERLSSEERTVMAAKDTIKNIDADILKTLNDSPVFTDEGT